MYTLREPEKQFIVLHLYKQPISNRNNKIDNKRFESVDI